MISLVVDASIAVKWVVDEDGTADVLALRRRAKLIAPDLLAAECANVLWKKARRDELSEDEACYAARLPQAADMELVPTRSMLEAATRLAIELDHPAYDCAYLALAIGRDCEFITADERFLRKLRQGGPVRLYDRVVGLRAAAAG